MHIPKHIRHTYKIPSNLPVKDAVPFLVQHNIKATLAKWAKCSPTTHLTKEQLAQRLLETTL